MTNDKLKEEVERLASQYPGHHPFSNQSERLAKDILSLIAKETEGKDDAIKQWAFWSERDLKEIQRLLKRVGELESMSDADEVLIERYFEKTQSLRSLLNLRYKEIEELKDEK